MSKKTNPGHVAVREHSKVLGNGDIYSKMPFATAEQINIAAIITKPINDERQKQHVLQLQELTRCSEERAFLALHDASGDIDKAVEFLLEGREDTWFTTSKRAKIKTAPKQTSASKTDEEEQQNQKTEEDRRKDKVELIREKVGIVQSKSVKSSDVDLAFDRRPVWKRDIYSRRDNIPANDHAEASSRPRSERSKPNQFAARRRLQSQNTVIHNNGDSQEGWDPAAEYGEWTGEAIEIINSNASIALNLNENQRTPIEVKNEFPVEDQAASSSKDFNKNDVSPGSQKSSRSQFHTNLFTKVATSKPPPPSFTVLPDVPVFLAHRPGCEASYKTTYKFNYVTTLLALIPSANLSVAPKDFSSHSISTVRSAAIDHQHPVAVDSHNQPSLSVVDSRVSLSHSSTPFAIDSSASALTSLLEATEAKDVIKTVEPNSAVVQDEAFCGNQFTNPAPVPKPAGVAPTSAYLGPIVPNQVANQYVGQHLATDQPVQNVHYNFKNYVNELSNTMTNLVVNERVNSSSPLSVGKISEFSQPQISASSVISETTIVGPPDSTAFVSEAISPNTQSLSPQQQSQLPQLSMVQSTSAASIQSVSPQLNKPMQPLIPLTMNKLPTTQHSSIQNASQQSHHQQPSAPPALPPNLPILSQFPPGYSLFNLSAAAAASNSAAAGGGPAAIVDLEQFNFIHQQHRLLYELQQQQQHHQAPQQQHQAPPQTHQGATTSPNPINPNTDPAASISKTISHSGQPTLSHTNAGIRPDLMPPMGHPPQVVTPAAPYYHYPLVLMNGYPNAFIGQQQQGGTGHQPSQPAPQPHQGQSSGVVASTTNQSGPGQGPQQAQAQQQLSANQLFTGIKAASQGGYPPQPTGFNPALPNVSSANYEDLVDVKYTGAKSVGFKANGQPPSAGLFAPPDSTSDACKGGVSLPSQSQVLPVAPTQSGAVANSLPLGLQAPTSGGSSGFPQAPQAQAHFGGPNNHIFGFYSNNSGTGPACVPSGTAGTAGPSVPGHNIPGGGNTGPDPNQGRNVSSASHMNAIVAAVFQQQQQQQQHQPQHIGVDLNQQSSATGAGLHHAGLHGAPPPVMMGVHHAGTNASRHQHHR